MNRPDEYAHTIQFPSARGINNLYKQAMLEGAEFEREAERCRMEAERAFKDVASMRDEGRRRAAIRRGRMLPLHERAVDVQTDTFKAMATARSDHVYYSAQAGMYAAMAAMKFNKAAALKR